VLTSSRRALTLVNAEISGLTATTLRISAARIVALGEPPGRTDLRVDLRGDRLFPGLINAHDHLQLNGYSQLIDRPRYQNAAQWIADVKLRLDSDPLVRAHRALPRNDRLLLGGIKNILSGVTTVAHHDPLHELLTDPAFPTGVLEHYGWSHSLFMDGEAAVQRSHHTTPANMPWIIHAAEGIDHDAAAEFERLEALQCLTSNTLIVHGIALSARQQARLAESGGGLIWCPSSNLNLFGTTPDVRALIGPARLALGTDSRLSGARDLLAELRIAHEISDLDEATLESLVTGNAAQMLRLPDRGTLQVGAYADLLVLPKGMPLWGATRADILLVLRNGLACYADPEYARRLDAQTDLVPVRIDARDKFLARSLAARLSSSKVQERGLEWIAPHPLRRDAPAARMGNRRVRSQ
jgi:cytosine/adenosine deaminase-related metal-dependent hydrolase